MQIITVPSGPLSVNTFLAVDEETKKGFIVDAAGYVPELKDKIVDEGYDIEYIICTHGHFDHIGGVNEFKNEFPGAKIVAHEADKAMMESSSINMSRPFGTDVKVTPDVLINDGDVLTVGNAELKFLHTPGHTPGGISIYVASANVVFSGDTLFRLSVGRTDFPESSHVAMVTAIKEKLYTLPAETVVLSGHTAATTIEFEKRNNPFVRV
jgi:glyoxylase-like metal-dependent hydrolase (beta-lactamase superfamily II)